MGRKEDMLHGQSACTRGHRGRRTKRIARPDLVIACAGRDAFCTAGERRLRHQGSCAARAVDNVVQDSQDLQTGAAPSPNVGQALDELTLRDCAVLERDGSDWIVRRALPIRDPATAGRHPKNGRLALPPAPVRPSIALGPCNNEGSGLSVVRWS
jgi:hypothetical protein